MTQDQFVALVFDEEGRTYAEPPAIDQPTGPGGVTLPELAAFRARPCLVSDLKSLTVAEAALVIAKRFNDADFGRISDEHLRVQLLDFAYNSGKENAVRWLQRTVNAFRAAAPIAVDGVIGPRTVVLVNNLPAVPLNNALAAERAHAAYHGGVAPKFAAGVAHRAIEFTVVLA